jgi:putative addiction module killer protein
LKKNRGIKIFTLLYSIEYNKVRIKGILMIEIKRLPEFDEWLDGIKDNMTRIRLNRRLDKVQRGNWGDIKSLQEGVWEMREFFGSGWRMYYIQHGDVVIVMLGGGDKSTQQQNIDRALKLSKTLED